jgi:hypothetical protein
MEDKPVQQEPLTPGSEHETAKTDTVLRRPDDGETQEAYLDAVALVLVAHFHTDKVCKLFPGMRGLSQIYRFFGSLALEFYPDTRPRRR